MTRTFPVSVLANANGVSITDSTFSITTNIESATKLTLDPLYQRVSPNAISNEGGRADDAKCHPGTREEVISLIERWMDAAESNRIFWLSGPAGGGKTAIVKTIIERSTNRDVQTVSFFFFRGDSTRTSAQPVIPTLLYQLFELYPPSTGAISKILSTRPRLLDGSIMQQCKLLSALFPIIRKSSPPRARIVLIVDGLDECDVDADRSQGDILRALEGLVLEADSPFRLLVASRPEARIKLAFNRLSSQARTMFLDETYSPEDDIRRFVTAEFNRIKLLHPSAHLLPSPWPSLVDVEDIVAKSSGQFIYAATVMRYLSHASTVPSLSLERVKGIVPSANNSPFTHLDSIYLFILSRADDPDVVQNMLSTALLQQIVDTDLSLKDFLSIYDPRYNAARVESCVSELSAIVQLTVKGDLKFYHASLPDFLVNKARSELYWIDVDAFRAKVLLALWESRAIKLNSRSSHHINLQDFLLSDLHKPTPSITHALLTLPLPDWTFEGYRHVGYFVQSIHSLYYRDDVKVYKHVLRRYVYMLVSHNIRPQIVIGPGVPYGKRYILFYQGLNFLLRLRKRFGSSQHRSK